MKNKYLIEQTDMAIKVPILFGKPHNYNKAEMGDKQSYLYITIYYCDSCWVFPFIVQLLVFLN